MSANSFGASQARLILGVDAATGEAGLRRAFRAAVKAAHPDRPGGSDERLRRVIEAYRLLQPLAAIRTDRRARPPRLIITAEDAVLGGWRTARLSEGGKVRLHLPAGLRGAEKISVDGQIMAVSIAANTDSAVLGDHLVLTAQVESALLRHGGRLILRTPTGLKSLWVTAQDGARGLMRLADQGLPARGRYARGHLFIRLLAGDGAGSESETRGRLRRFNAAWAA